VEGAALALNRGLEAPKGTPMDIVAKLEEASRKTLEDPEFIKTMEKERVMLRFIGREGYRKYVENQNDMLKQMWADNPWR